MRAVLSTNLDPSLGCCEEQISQLYSQSPNKGSAATLVAAEAGTGQGRDPSAGCDGDCQLEKAERCLALGCLRINWGKSYPALGWHYSIG